MSGGRLVHRFPTKDQRPWRGPPAHDGRSGAGGCRRAPVWATVNVTVMGVRPMAPAGPPAAGCQRGPAPRAGRHRRCMTIAVYCGWGGLWLAGGGGADRTEGDGTSPAPCRHHSHEGLWTAGGGTNDTRQKQGQAQDPVTAMWVRAALGRPLPRCGDPGGRRGGEQRAGAETGCAATLRRRQQPLFVAARGCGDREDHTRQPPPASTATVWGHPA